MNAKSDHTCKRALIFDKEQNEKEFYRQTRITAPVDEAVLLRINKVVKKELLRNRKKAEKACFRSSKNTYKIYTSGVHESWYAARDAS